MVRVKRREAESVTTAQEDQAQEVATTTTAQEVQVAAAVEKIHRQNIVSIKNAQVEALIPFVVEPTGSN